MSIFKKDVPQFFSEKGGYIKKEMEDFYDFASTANLDFWSEASIDSRFEAGDQDVYLELHPEIPTAFRKQFGFNRIKRIKNMISGSQRKNRKSTVVTPVTNGDQETADQYSKIISHIHRKEHVLETVSDAFEGAMISGISLLNLYIDFREDPVSGSIKLDNIPFNSFMIDPYFKKRDLSDCNQIWRRSYLNKSQVISLMPDRKTEIELLSGQMDSVDFDGKFNYMPEALGSKSDLMAYDEYYSLDTRKQTLLIDSTTGEVMEWQNDTKVGEQELAELLRLHPDITLEEQQIKTVKLSILVNGSLLYSGSSPLGIDEYPFVPVLAYFNPSLETYSMRVQSVVRGLRDAQWLYNRRKAIEDDILSSQVNSGYIYKEEALVDPKDVFSTGQGKGVAIKSTSMISDIVKIQPGQIPPSMFQMSELYAREIMEISGANEELLGSATDDKAGVLSMLRQGAGLTTLQPLFDGLDQAQKILGSIMLKSIQINYTPGKVKKIIEEEPAQQFYNKAFGKYDAAIEEGFNTTTQKQNEFAQILHLKEIGVPIPDEVIIEAATLQNKTKLVEAIKQQQESAQQQEMQQAQIQQELVKAQTELAKAKVESDLSLAKERDSRVFSNIGLMEERQHEAEKDKTQSMLNLVKTLQEMDDIDISQLTKLVQLSQVVENKTLQNNKVEKMSSAIVGGVTKDVPEVPDRSNSGQPGSGQTGAGQPGAQGQPGQGL